MKKPQSSTQPSGQGGKSRREPRWPASLTVLVIIVLYATLPDRLTLGPPWLSPAVVLVVLVPLSVAVPHRHPEELAWQRAAAVAMIGIVSIANAYSLVLLVQELLSGVITQGAPLILEAMQIWLVNVLVFGLWYWELDRGGPGLRQLEAGAPSRQGAGQALPLPVQQRLPDFLFPQIATAAIASPDWRPIFVDYLYISFTNAMAFSPTDTLPLTPWAKLLMLLQSLVSLLTVALVAARAVNILN